MRLSHLLRELSELRSIIEEADCDPGIIRRVMAGRSLPAQLDDAKTIRSIIWPALLGVRKRDVGEIEDAKSDLLEKAFSEHSISPESIPVAVLFCQSRGIELSEPVGSWVHLLKPISLRVFKLLIFISLHFYF